MSVLHACEALMQKDGGWSLAQNGFTISRKQHIVVTSEPPNLATAEALKRGHKLIKHFVIP